MAGEFAYQVRVFDFLVEVAYEGAAGHMRAGHVTDRVLLRLFGDRVDDGNDSFYAGSLETHANQVIELAGGHKREYAVLSLSLVFVQNLNGGRGEVHLDYARILFFCLAWDVVDRNAILRLNDVVLRQGEEVADTAAYVALEHEYVSGEFYFLIIVQIGVVEQVSFLCGEIVRCAVFLGAYRVFAEWVISGVAHIHTPAPICADGTHIGDNGVVAALDRYTLVLGVVPDIFVFLDWLEDGAVFFLLGLKEGVLVPEEFLKCYQGVGSSLVKIDWLAGVELEPFDDAEDGPVALVTLIGNLLELEEVFNLVEEEVLVRVGAFEVLRVEETVDLLLCPVQIEVTFGHFVPLLGDEVYDLVDCSLSFLGFADFIGDDSVLDDDFSIPDSSEQCNKGVRL